MNFSELVNFIAESVGFALPDLIILFTALGALIFAAKDLKVGLVAAFIMFAGEFIIFSSLSMQTNKILLALLLSFIFMTVSLYTSPYKQQIN